MDVLYLDVRAPQQNATKPKNTTTASAVVGKTPPESLQLLGTLLCVPPHPPNEQGIDADQDKCRRNDRPKDVERVFW